METLMGTLRQTREGLIERGTKVAGAARELRLDALRKVRGRAVDWRRTLAAARRAGLDEPSRGFPRFADLSARAIDAADRLLARLSARVRDEMKRLQKLELPGPAEPKASDEAPDEASEPAEQPRSGAAEPDDAVASEPSAPAETKTKKSVRSRANGRASATGPRKSAAPKRFVLPIAEYDSLTVREIMAELPRLSAAQCKAVLEFERAHKKRKTVLTALESRLPS